MKNKNKALGLIITLFLSSFLATIAISNTENIIESKIETNVDIPQISAGTTKLWEHNSSVTGMGSLTMTADGFYLAYTLNNQVFALNKTNNITIWSFNATESVNAAKFSADGSILAIGTANWVRLFNMTSATPNVPYWNYSTSEDVSQIDISADGMYIFAVANTGALTTLYFFNKTDDSVPMWTYDHGSSMRDLAMSADGEYMYAGGEDNNLYMFNKSISGIKTYAWVYDNGARVDNVATSANGFYVIIGGLSGSAVLLTNAKNILWTFALLSQCGDVDISSDGNYIVVTTFPPDRQIYLFSKIANVPLWSYQHANPADYLAEVDISAKGCYIVAGSNATCPVYLFSKGSFTPLLQDSTIEKVDSVVISADGKYFASIDQDLPNNTLTLFQNDDTSCIVDGGDVDGSEPPPDAAIPFGWFFLLISAISVLAIVIKQKRKVL